MFENAEQLASESTQKNSVLILRYPYKRSIKGYQYGTIKITASF